LLETRVRAQQVASAGQVLVGKRPINPALGGLAGDWPALPLRCEGGDRRLSVDGFVGETVHPAEGGDLLLLAVTCEAGRVVVGQLRGRLRIEVVGRDLRCMQAVVALPLGVIPAGVLLDAEETGRSAHGRSGAAEVAEFSDGLLEANAVSGAVEEVADRRVLRRHGSLVDALLEALHHAADHVFLRDCSAPDGDCRPLGAGPHLYHSALVDANIVALDGEASYHPRQLVEPHQHLLVEMQHIGEWDVPKITESNGDLLQEQRCFIFGGAKLRVLKLFLQEIDDCDPAGIVLADEGEFADAVELFLGSGADAVPFDVDTVVCAVLVLDYFTEGRGHLSPVTFVKPLYRGLLAPHDMLPIASSNYYEGLSDGITPV
jgi:hypothetical protein